MTGGAMRTTTKATVMGAYRSVKRRTPTTLPLQVSSGPLEVAPASHALSSEAGPVDALPVMKPSSEIDNWVVVGGEEELFDAMDPHPRLVFGPVPTLEEATEATLELKDAVERVYFSSPTPTNAKTSSNQSNLENLETKTSVGSECGTIVPSMPNHVFQAFALLQGSPEAQSVVASLVSDANVWDAVMKNEKVMQFYKSHQTTLAPISSAESDGDAAEGDSKESSAESDGDAADRDSKESSVSSETHPSEQSSESTTQNGFMSFVESIKMKVSEMVNNLADFFRDIVAPSFAAITSSNENTSTAEHNAEVTMDSFFITLAIGTIIVVLLQRGW